MVDPVPAPSPLAKAPTVAPALPRYGTTHRSPTTSRWRFIRANVTTFTVIFSYLWLRFAARAFGKSYRDDRIGGAHKRNAHRVYVTILALQGLFIKIGQLLSIMANFLPPEFRVELEGLQDRVPPRPFDEIEERVESELKGTLGDFFAKVDPTPIASASLGQVHEAWLKDGSRVALKVQHRDIDEVVRLDLKTIRWIMRVVQWFFPMRGLEGYYHQFKQMLAKELDFEAEAAHIETIAKNFTTDPMIVFPVPVRSHCTRRVLTTSFVEGKKVNDIDALDAMGIDRKELARRLVRAYCQMIFIDGTYHADPHPGNILVRKDGALILLDFGAVAELSPQMRDGIPEFLEGVLRRDTERIIKALKKMGFLSLTSDSEVSEKVVEYFHRRFQEEIKLESFNLKDIKIDPQRGFENLLDLRKMNIGMKELSDVFVIPKDWILLERTVLLLYGCCSILDPELNPFTVIQPYLQEFVLGSRDWAQIAMEAVKDMVLSAATLPEDLRKYLTKATRGELEVRVRGFDEGTRVLGRAARQIVYAMVAIAAGYATLLGRVHHDAPVARVSFAITLISGGLLLLSLLFGRG